MGVPVRWCARLRVAAVLRTPPVCVALGEAPTPSPTLVRRHGQQEGRRGAACRVCQGRCYSQWWLMGGGGGRAGGGGGGQGLVAKAVPCAISNSRHVYYLAVATRVERI